MIHTSLKRAIFGFALLSIVSACAPIEGDEKMKDGLSKAGEPALSAPATKEETQEKLRGTHCQGFRSDADYAHRVVMEVVNATANQNVKLTEEARVDALGFCQKMRETYPSGCTVVTGMTIHYSMPGIMKECDLIKKPMPKVKLSAKPAEPKKESGGLSLWPKF